MEFENSIWRHYHESSKDRAKGHPSVPLDSSKWPEEWKTILYKSYPRLPKLMLPKPTPLETSLGDSLAGRSSFRMFNSEPIDFDKLSNILYWSLGIREGEFRNYPSGGARFPVEAYVCNLVGTEGFASGVYHYGVRDHSLEVVWKHDFDRVERDQMCPYPWAKRASVMIILTAVFGRTIPKYGERGYRFILLEAGHIGQNIALTSAALGVKCCSLGGTNDMLFESLFDIDPAQESVVYGVALGI